MDEISGHIIQFLDSEELNENSFDYYLAYSGSILTTLPSTQKYYVPFNEETGHPDRGEFGDNYINSLRMGIFASLKVSITSTSKEAINILKGSLKGSYGDIGGFNASLDKLDSDLRSSVQVKITAIQLGGDVDKLSSVLGPTEAGDGIYNCTLTESGLSRCQDLLYKFQKYASDSTNGGLVTQLKTYVTDLTKRSVTYRDLHILFPIDNDFATLSTKATGKYYNENSQTKSNTVYPVDPDLKSKVIAANAKYDEIISALGRLVQIKTITGHMWNVAAVDKSQKELTDTADKLYSIVTSLCTDPAVLDDESLRADCIENLNPLLNQNPVAGPFPKFRTQNKRLAPLYH